MKTIDELMADKIMEFVDFMLSKFIKPDITISNVTKLTVEDVEKIKTEYGIEGVILDVDDTLRTDMKNIPKCNQDWLESLRGRLKVIILSNGKDEKIEEYFAKNGIDYIGFAHKPLKKNFIKACERMNLTPDKVMVVGNSLFDDVYGGNRNQMKTMLVKNVRDDER